MPLILIATCIALLGSILMGFAGPMMRGEIEPNRTVGLRAADTLADPEVWYAANAASGRDLFRLGAVLVVAAVLLPWVLGRAAGAVLLALVLGGLPVVGVLGSLRAEQLRARCTRTSPRSAPPAR